MNKESILLDKLAQIHTILSETVKDEKEIGVLSGMSGIALFHFYYAKFLGEESIADIGVDVITLLFQKINDGYSFPTFCSGIAGAAWAIELLQEEDFIDVNSDELLSELDDFLIHTIKEMETGDNYFDFLHGTLGIGFYFFKRYQKTQSIELKNTYKEQLLYIINLLENASQKEGNMIKWESYLIRKDKLKGVNLGLSHGMPSIINFLSRLAAHDIFYDQVESLIKNATNFVLHHQNKDTSNSSLFPSWVYEGMDTNANARLAWCYGDLGIGITLWRAGKATNDKELQQNAITILKHSAIRRDRIECNVKDAGLCHGAFGIMHIYNYMYKETKEELFKETADFWIDEGMAMAHHENGYAGYMQWTGGENEGWRLESGLLEGIAGIGLSIISYLAPFETKWDECLLIS